ncbi:MAG: NAD(P)H-dependent glycerol-3-phosphate dehydrogenase [Candidatus Altimarinota bacterium]
MIKRNVAIIGNGVYGTALAFLFGKKHDITVFGRDIKNESEFPISDFGKQIKHFDYLIISITTRGLTDLLPRIYQNISTDTHVIIAMKGLTSSGLLPVEECQKLLPNHQISVLSGPGFAEEIVAGIPVHLVLAGKNFSEDEEEDFLLDSLTLDFSDDIIGVSWCGVLKNIYAIGAGIASKNEEFDRSSFTRDAVHEMASILVNLGGSPESAHGPAGRGDMWICTTIHSRNFRFGRGEHSLRDQAEGYNALINFQERFPHIFEGTNFPILTSIRKTIL